MNLLSEVSKIGVVMYKLIFIISVLVTFSTTIYAQEKTLTFAIVPQQSAKILATLWTPIIEHLNEQTGLNIEFSTAKDIPTFEKRLKLGEYDIAYMNPYHYVEFNKSAGYAAIAKQQDKTITGIIVAKKDGNINTIYDLEGMQLAFPSPASFAATILSQAELNKLNIAYTPTYVSSHDSVYLNVSRGFFLAGGGINRTLNNMPLGTKSTLKTIWQSKKYTSHAIAIHPRIKSESSDKLLNALINMNNSESGKVLLKSINFKGFEKAVNSDWDDVRALNIEMSITAKNTNQ